MRPRHLCRGRQASPGPYIRYSRCFNEAPAFMPGKTLPGLARRTRLCGCFNEAPAFMPGKTIRVLPFRRVHLPRFNEAPAFMPGKTEIVLHGTRHKGQLQ